MTDEKSPKKLGSINIAQSPSKFVGQIKKEQNELRKKTLFLAYLFGRLSKQGVDSYLVGGEAVELYTAGQFATGAVDITTTDRSVAEKLLHEMGFRKDGMILLNEDLRIAVQIVGRSPSRTEKVRSIEIEGLIVKIVGVEDLIIDRLVASKYWRSNPKIDIEQASVLFHNFKNTLDLIYLKKRANEEQVEDFFEKIS